ncbi:MAG: murein biosynthesis integral membrane protein MurJ [Phormidesmis priestleyi]|uniref:Probable lipid II flippase MurJ n=1 Tax=Phormidesmis priestleyi TaxID=268141 RepID=A0A2W4WW65_9CYAN|nr:MAG: murein biosynthesis integral membrane protein MurJ [Phormidesmis priestleyi]
MGKRSLAGIAGIVAIATLLSKVFGLLRETAIAAAFGTGPVTDAYGIAYVIPGFLLVLLGGINGPFHSAIVSAVSKRKKADIAPIVETVTTVVGIGLIGVSIGMFVFAEPIIDLLGRGFLETDVGAVSRQIAITQLRIMAPITVFACFIGIGFGTLNADDQYWLPSISPLLSSTAVIASLGVFWALTDGDISNANNVMLGGIVLAVGSLVGAILQWLIQVPALWKSGLGRLRLRFNVQDPGVRDVLKVLGPATLSSGTLQINVYTDLFFAAFVPGTLAALGFANLLVQTPLGIVSNIILVPFFPIFSRLTDPAQWPELKQRIRQSLVLVALTMLPISAVIITLAEPIVTVVYKRGNFDEEAVQLVTLILIAYAVGMFVYLARDVMVRVFYALGDGQTPFRISLVNIAVNAVLDFVLFNLMGPAGLVVATIGVNIVSLVAMTVLLNRKIGGLPMADWARTMATLTAAAAVSGVSCWLTLGGLTSLIGAEGFLANLILMTISGAISLATFALLTVVLGIPEAAMLAARIRQKFGR